MATHKVSGYMRKDGTYVRPHDRVSDTSGRAVDGATAAKVKSSDVARAYTSPDDATEVPESLTMWQVERSLAPVPENSSAERVDEIVMVVQNLEKKKFTSDELGAELNKVSRQAHYGISGATFVGLVEPAGSHKNGNIEYTLTPAGRQYAAMDAGERKRAMGAMMCNVDEVWLTESDLREHLKGDFNRSTLDARVGNFLKWGETARQHLRDSGFSDADINRYAEERREEALGNIGDYEYATHTPQPPRKGLDWEQRDDEEVCEHCWLLRIKNSDVCVDNGQCGRSC